MFLGADDGDQERDYTICTYIYIYALLESARHRVPYPTYTRHSYRVQGVFVFFLPLTIQGQKMNSKNQNVGQTQKNVEQNDE